MAPLASEFSDDFAKDTALNPSLWQINGSAAANFSSVDCGGPCTFVNLTPTFSNPAGMEIANINGSSEVGSISSVQAFTPPFTATAIVEGTVSNGHTFIFGVANLNATAGVQMTGNLDSRDCAAETNCGDHSTCGTPANATLSWAQGACYYGLYGRVGAQGGWSGKTWLVDSPSLSAAYTLQISIDTSGTAVGQVSQGGQILATASAPVGSGPFYLIIAQGEGAPVPGPGPNQAYWQMVNVTSSVLPVPGSGSGSSGSDWWIIIVVIIVAIVVIALVVFGRRHRREFTVTVLDEATLSPVSGAGVSVDGPSSLSGSTRADGRIAFGGAKDGAYSLKASAAGYTSPPPVTVTIARGNSHTVRLTRVSPPAPQGPPPGAVSPTPARPAEAPPVAVPSTAPTASLPTAVSTPAAPAGPVELEPGEGGEGFVGMRIREIVKTFQEKGALSPETALTAQELGLSRMFVRIMKRRRGQTRVFVEIGGKYYLDEKALREMK